MCSEETAVPDDTQINDMMACNEAEFALYQKMDKEREAARRKDTPALIPANEIPSWARTPEMWLNKHQQLYVMVEQSDKMKAAMGKAKGNVTAAAPGEDESMGMDEAEEFTHYVDGDYSFASDAALGGAEGTNKRKRKAVTYNDGLSEAQFISMVERTGRVSSIISICCFVV